MPCIIQINHKERGGDAGYTENGIIESIQQINYKLCDLCDFSVSLW